MLVGRDYRKRFSQLAAYAVYRYIAVWLIVYACVTYGEFGQAVALGVIAVSIMIGAIWSSLELLSQHQSREYWKDQLTNQLFYGLFWERLKNGEQEHLDVEQLFKEARKEALADIESADRLSRVKFGFLDGTGWHWFGSVIHFFGLLVWDLLFYGSAFWLGGYRP